MDINRVSRPDRSANYGISAASDSSGGKSGDGFRDQFGNQLKDNYKRQLGELFDEINDISDSLEDKMSISSFERYREKIMSLLNGVVQNAYVLSSELVTDPNGRQRMFATVNVVDEKLDALAKRLLSDDHEQLDFMSCIDEIRGLIMDMFL